MRGTATKDDSSIASYGVSLTCSIVLPKYPRPKRRHHEPQSCGGYRHCGCAAGLPRLDRCFGGFRRASLPLADAVAGRRAMTTSVEAYAVLRARLASGLDIPIRWQGEDADNQGNVDIPDVPAAFAYAEFY